MINESTTQFLTKDEISSKIFGDKNFKEILKSYKNEKTEAYLQQIVTNSKSGLTNNVYYVTLNNELLTIIVPIFSTEKTITWNSNYLDIIKTNTPENIKLPTEDKDIINLIKCPLFFMDKYTEELIFMALIDLKEWLEHGSKGKSSPSVYFWNDKIPYNITITKKDIISDLFVACLPHYSKKELQELCFNYALKYYQKFNNFENKRSENTLIKNIATGLYAQLVVYNQLVCDGYDVNMEWNVGDDLGIDITYKINNEYINIDVKSTKTKELKISKNRKETHFYAVVTWNKTVPKLEGFLFKYDFWKSKYNNNTTEPILNKDGMYCKELNTLKLLKIEELFGIFNKYKINKLKSKEKLFNNA